ncbi:hypothetical protein V5P93_007239 [Actinokineospora auranticolor]|uniref:Uncharacterized protein n=1 Tax=Actinokineospora auranticolor TaxID=155976 RepID=A0A2S6GRL0_9PSEU|nr:hypothetical protein [Actinokineospora auranticolor]PPK67895.1 hypothetical protein CLV40_106126 [Actinokineospora auranticolor]
MPASGPPPLLTVRTAVILTLGLLFGALVGGLTFLGGGAVAVAVLSGITGTGGSIAFLHKVVH